METQQSKYDPCRPAYIINPEAHSGNLEDAIHLRLEEAHALVMGMTGNDEAQTDWSLLSGELQQGYIGALHRTVTEVRELFDAYTEANRKGGDNG